ncbi:hypothetical protein RCK22_22600, partial [Salmonella enterica subsp. enterica serovar Stanley]
MDVTNDDYIRLLSALLPPGPAWSASDPASGFHGLEMVLHLS